MTSQASRYVSKLSRRSDADLEPILHRTLALGSLIEKQLGNALSALTNGNTELAKRVVRGEQVISRMETLLYEECLQALVMGAPAASDPRLALAIIKASPDLGRIGDECARIGHVVARMTNQETPLSSCSQLNHLGRLAEEMLHDALDALNKLDTEAIIDVARRNQLVDLKYEEIQRQFIHRMMEDPRTIRQSLDLIDLARALQRIGYHTNNLCEYAVILVHGTNTRDRKLDYLETTTRTDNSESENCS